VSFQPGWDQGFKKDQFAVLPCPAWMLGHLQKTPPDQKGKGDIATVPGGAGNRGGSFWTVPSEGRNVDAAVSFVKWLVQPEQQIAVENVITRVQQGKLAPEAAWTEAVKEARKVADSAE
jgi:cellobiose transport system substrate-binding protein